MSTTGVTGEDDLVNGEPIEAPHRCPHDDVGLPAADDLGPDRDPRGLHEQGACGACTVLVDGRADPLSCLLLAVMAEGTAVRTVESLVGPSGEMSPLQGGVPVEHGAAQCGFLHAGLPHADRRAAGRPGSRPRSGWRAYMRGVQPVPLHGLQPHHRSGHCGGYCGPAQTAWTVGLPVEGSDLL